MENGNNFPYTIFAGKSHLIEFLMRLFSYLMLTWNIKYIIEIKTNSFLMSIDEKIFFYKIYE